MFTAALRPAFMLLGLASLLLGVAYPALITGIAQLAFPFEANGSLLVTADGQTRGSALIGQPFAAPGYLRSRPSATGAGPYDGASSSGSNLGPLNPALDSAVQARVAVVRAEAGVPAERFPADLVTASGSGLDPHVSPAAARLQVARIAGARGVAAAEIQRILDRYTEGRTAGMLGEPRVHVLRVNLALDSLRAGGLR
jgi:K+-transporting ATPase ATPase C chain